MSGGLRRAEDAAWRALGLPRPSITPLVDERDDAEVQVAELSRDLDAARCRAIAAMRERIRFLRSEVTRLYREAGIYQVTRYTTAPEGAVEVSRRILEVEARLEAAERGKMVLLRADQDLPQRLQTARDRLQAAESACEADPASQEFLAYRRALRAID